MVSIFFFGVASAFNQPLNSWDVQNVQDMEEMFEYDSAFNQPLYSWNVAKVQTMNQMFFHAKAFNQNLCNFGDYYDSGNDYGNMFQSSDCDYNDYRLSTPTSANGPWCTQCP